MIHHAKEFAHSAEVCADDRALAAVRPRLKLGVGAFAVLAGCGVLASVWHVAADENRRRAIAAVEALGRARGSCDRVEAIRDLVRSVVIESPVVLPPLIRSLGDPTVEVRVEAARSLGPAASSAALERARAACWSRLPPRR